jgi:2-polyprenyl-6-methoxyphenol hydroxylase-like FAD-dependent oxidoreductase
MRIAIIGAGPAGLFTGAALARRGHDVQLIERDTGPEPDGSWARRGVMQFHHAHAFRPQVAAALQAELPSAYQAWLAAGAEPIVADVAGQSNVAMGLRSRRSTFEAALRESALAVTGVVLRGGHVDEVVAEGGRAIGVRVDGSVVAADLVIDASGRSGRATRSLRPETGLGGDCGIAYVDRQYQLHPGVGPGPLTNPIAFQATYDGYLVLIFPHEQGIFSTVIARSTADHSLRDLRHDRAFEAAAAAIPAVNEWTDADRSRPITAVLPGGTLKNVYCPQTRSDGELVLPGLIFVGDAVCTTTPNFGRGMATTMMQCEEVLRLLDSDRDLDAVGQQFATWCDTQIKPWVIDHIEMDGALRQRWDGHDIDLARPLPSDLILEAAEQEPRIYPVMGPYLAMTALPETLRVVEPLARAVYESGWRPRRPPGPSRTELAEIARAAA